MELKVNDCFVDLEGRRIRVEAVRGDCVKFSVRGVSDILSPIMMQIERLTFEDQIRIGKLKKIPYFMV